VTNSHDVTSTLEVGAIIRSRRLAMGLSQGDLAKRLGASRRWVSDIEAGKETAELGRVLHALTFLGVVMTLSGKEPVEERASPSRELVPPAPEPIADIAESTPVEPKAMSVPVVDILAQRDRYNEGFQRIDSPLDFLFSDRMTSTLTQLDKILGRDNFQTGPRGLVSDTLSKVLSSEASKALAGIGETPLTKLLQAMERSPASELSKAVERMTIPESPRIHLPEVLPSLPAITSLHSHFQHMDSINRSMNWWDRIHAMQPDAEHIPRVAVPNTLHMGIPHLVELATPSSEAEGVPEEASEIVTASSPDKPSADDDGNG